MKVGLFDAATEAATRWRQVSNAEADLPIERLRGARPEPRVLPPLEEEVGRLVAQGVEALARGDVAAAEAVANEAAAAAPERAEPIELLLVSAVARNARQDFRTAAAALAEVDPSSPIVLALSGLDAMRDGNVAAALGALAWFVGDDALVCNGTIAVRPIAAGQVEEQCAIAALRLGHPSAALIALDAAAASRIDDPRSLLRLGLLRADALRALGRANEALDVLGGVAGTGSSRGQILPRSSSATSPDSIALPLLAQIRIDSLRAAQGQRGDVLEEAVEDALRADVDGFALMRVMRLAQGASDEDLARAASRVETNLDRDRLESLRSRVILSALRRSREFDRIASAIVRDPSDRPALRWGFRLLAGMPDGLATAVQAARSTVAAHPDELESVTLALLGSGSQVDEVLARIEEGGSDAAGDAIRSRIYGQFGFAEDAFSIADAARARDRASLPALAACARSAADLDDGTLLAEVHGDIQAVGAYLARTMSECSRRLEAFTTTDVRGADARALDPMDSRIRGLRAPSADAPLGERSIDTPAVDALGVGCDFVSVEAMSAAAQAWQPEGRASSATQKSSSGELSLAPSSRGFTATAALIVAARSIQGSAHPVALECIALAEELDPTAGCLRELSVRGTALRSNEPAQRWMQSLSADAPGLPARRRLRLRFEAGVVPALEQLPAAPLSARFDALSVAGPELQAAERRARLARRPRTPTAVIEACREFLSAGDAEMAGRTLTSLLYASSRPLSTRDSERLLLVAGEVAVKEPDFCAEMRSLTASIVSRSEVVVPSTIRASMQVMVATRAGQTELDALVLSLARKCRASGDPGNDRAEITAVLQELLGTGDDPYVVARLAEALSRESRLDDRLRGLLGNAAIALYAASGAPVAEAIELIDELARSQVKVFARGNGSMTRADSLLGASNAYALIGDVVGSEALLVAALDDDPASPSALNNLAYARLEAGRFDAETLSLAERAAALRPGDATILDTLGVCRYHEGRLRDDASGPGAITLLRQALRLRPEDPSLATLDHLGDALWRDGDQAGAVKTWQQISQVALLRYPPIEMARTFREFQRREFGVEVLQGSEFIRREYGRIVERAERKLSEVSRGVPPSVAPLLGRQ